MNLLLLTLLACGSAVAPAVNCEPLDEPTCGATAGCFPITTLLVDCADGTSTPTYAGCLGPRHASEDTALMCEDISFFCQTDDMDGFIWDFRNYCIPDSVVCARSSMASSSAAACAEIEGE